MNEKDTSTELRYEVRPDIESGGHYVYDKLNEERVGPIWGDPGDAAEFCSMKNEEPQDCGTTVAMYSPGR